MTAQDRTHSTVKACRHAASVRPQARPCRVAIKAYTEHHPSSLKDINTAGLAATWHQYLLSAGPRCSHTVTLSAAVRFGCVLINLTTYQLQAEGAEWSSQHVLECAKQLLPTVAAQITPGVRGSCNSDAPIKLRMQIGDHTVLAVRDPATLEWQFEVVDAPAEQLPDTPSIHLAQPCPATVQPPTDQAVPDGHHLVSFTVRCAGVVGPVQGSDPHAPVQPQASSQSALKLWVQSQGQYLKTVSVTQQPLQPGLLHVTVQLPSTALARHHQPDGPVAQLQLLTAELWTAADIQLSSTPVLLDVAKHLHPAVPPDSISNWGWWGALGGADAAAVVHEVSLMTDATTQYADLGFDSTGVVESRHEEFVQDLAAWLTALQHTAPSTCCDMVPSTGSRYPSIMPQQLSIISQELLHYATVCTLPSVKAMVQGQLAAVMTSCVTAAPPEPCRMSSVSPLPAIQHLSQRASCRMCDVVYHSHLRRHLQRAQRVLGLVVGVGTYAVVHRMTATAIPALQWAALLTFVMRVAAAAASTLTQPPLALHHRMWQRVVVALHLVAWVLHLSTDAGLALGYIMVHPGKCSLATLGPYITTHALFTTITHHVALWGLVPTLLVRLLVCAETLMHAHMLHSCQDLHGLYKLTFTASTVMVPWLLDRHWRCVLRGRARRAAARSTDTQHLQLEKAHQD